MRTTRPIGKASKRCVRDRTEAQEVQAKNRARTKRTTNVSRQSSLCRFSNCSKREEMAARLSACCVDRPAVWGARWLSSCMKVDGTLQSQESSARKSYTPYCRNSNRISAIKAVTGSSSKIPIEVAHKRERRPGASQDAVR